MRIEIAIMATPDEAVNTCLPIAQIVSLRRLDFCVPYVSLLHRIPLILDTLTSLEVSGFSTSGSSALFFVVLSPIILILISLSRMFTSLVEPSRF